MSAKLTSASFEIGVAPERQPRSVARDSQRRFTIVVMGDFTGRANRGVIEPLDARKPVAMDCDNFEQVLARLDVRLRLPDPGASGADVELAFSSLDHFHPDRLVGTAAPLAGLSEARRLLLDPSTAEQGRTALQAVLGAAIGTPIESAKPAEPAKTESDDQTMDRLLGGAMPSQARPAAASPAEQFIRQIVTPHVAPAAASWQQGALAAADLELAQRLRAILHHPDFQSLEAAWRGADLLIRHIEATNEIGVFLLDISQAELQAALLDTETSEAPPLLRLLRDRQVSLIAGNHTFGRSADDLRVLGRLAEIAADLGAPFVATASPELAGCDSFALHPYPDDWKTALPPEVESAWHRLRNSPAAQYIGLAAPRFLLRQPYGPSGDAVAAFAFEELPGKPAHESFLWGHPAMLCACVFAESLSGQLADERAEFEAPSWGEIGDLPVHKFVDDGEPAIMPYAEAWLTDRAADRMTACGIMPLLSRKDINSVRLPSLHSVAAPARPLPFPPAAR
jgi:type VI secretion system protein ImpC